MYLKEGQQETINNVQEFFDFKQTNKQRNSQFMPFVT